MITNQQVDRIYWLSKMELKWWTRISKVLNPEGNLFKILKGFLLIGKLMGFSIFTVIGDDMQTMDFQVNFLDIFLYLGYLSANLCLLYFGRFGETKENSEIVTFGVELVLLLSVATGVISSTLMIVFRRNLLKILKLYHQIDTQVGITFTLLLIIRIIAKTEKQFLNFSWAHWVLA